MSARTNVAADSTVTSDRNIPRILLVDDDPETTQAIEMRLVNYDVEIVRRFTGMQGIGEVSIEKPDLIITDLKMPLGEGDDLLKCVKQNEATAHIPVIVLSRQPGEHLPGQMRKTGAAAFLRKPVHYLDLLREISKHIELRDLNWATVDADRVQYA